jgi:C1A family cysteine protease
MKATLILLVLAAFVCSALAVRATGSSSLEAKKLFADFKKQYHKLYTPREEQRRFSIFQENLRKAAENQAKNPKARFGVNKFSDLSTEEFAQKYLMPNFDKSKFPKLPAKNFSAPARPNARGCSPDPTTYDWDSCGVCTPVYNQGQCGSCWAFSATETIESYFALDGGQLTQLSMQQIVDCDTGGQDQGCNGGFPSSAYQYVQSAGGLDPLSDYPYTAEDGTCAFNAQEVVATVTNSQSISGESGLYSQTSSSSGGPVSVCVDASSWSSYNGGVLTSCGNNVDHCVQLVGYNGYNSDGAYWVVRNSWGTDWGENGFIWIQIGQDLCSIGDYATIVTAAAK